MCVCVYHNNIIKKNILLNDIIKNKKKSSNSQIQV